MLLRPPHHRLPRQLAAILALTALLTLTACGPREPSHPTTPTPSGTAASGFASDEEALAAAEAVYREYLRVVDKEPDLRALRKLATADVIAAEVDTLKQLTEQGLHTEGATELKSFTLQSLEDDKLTAYACLDVSGVRILTSSGADATPGDRPDQGTLEVVFVREGISFLVSESNLWSTSC